MMIEIFDKNRRRIAIAENAYGVSEDQKINALWYLHFSLPYDDSKNEYCQPFNYVRSDGGELYRIMPSAERIDDTGGIEYQCEHVLATLLDNVLFGYHVVGNLGVYTSDCINYVLNHQITKNWVLGQCEFRRQFEYGWEQENLLSALFSIASPLSGYMWETDTSVYPWRLNLRNLGASTTPELYVRYAWNMLGFEESKETQQICTRLYPLGYGEGVNQLGIGSINGGLPYIQSPQAYIEKYGIVERIWIDRRYEDVESLKSAAEVMLSELQEPLRQFSIEFAALDASNYNTAKIGKRMRIEHPRTHERIDTYITEIQFERDDIPSSRITVANRSTDIASSVADMADRQRIEQAYSQGATQLYAQTLQANCDSKSGAVLNFFLPADMRIINSVEIKVKMSAFRAYSQTTESVSAVVQSTTTQNSQAVTSSGGGGTSTSTESGGGATSRATALESSNVKPNETTGQEVHNHGIPSGTKIASYDTSGNIEGYVWWTPSGAHIHPEHTHDIPSHSHGFSLDAHTHNVTIPSHSHNVTIPAHNHEIKAGIFTFGSPNAFDVIVNGTKRKTITGSSAEVNITEFLVDANSAMIPRGTWHSVEIRPNDIAYVSIDMYVQGFVQSRGDATV